MTAGVAWHGFWEGQTDRQWVGQGTCARVRKRHLQDISARARTAHFARFPSPTPCPTPFFCPATPSASLPPHHTTPTCGLRLPPCLQAVVLPFPSCYYYLPSQACAMPCSYLSHPPTFLCCALLPFLPAYHSSLFLALPPLLLFLCLPFCHHLLPTYICHHVSGSFQTWEDRTGQDRTYLLWRAKQRFVADRAGCCWFVARQRAW